MFVIWYLDSTELNCTFDQDLCGFTQATSDNFDWTRNRGGTPSASTGPSRDHTTGNGTLCENKCKCLKNYF